MTSLPPALADYEEPDDDETVTPGALRQRRYRASRKASPKASPVTRNASPQTSPEASPVTSPDLDGDAFEELPKASPVTSPVTPKRNASPRNASPKKASPKKASRLPVELKDSDYAAIFQAFHTVAAGATGLSSLYVSEEEAVPVGKALKTCADYYGWDFVEKLGPAFMLAITLGTVEVKVIGRAREEIPAKRAAQRAKQAPKTPRMTVVPPEETASPPPKKTLDQLLADAEAQALAIPENLVPDFQGA